MKGLPLGVGKGNCSKCDHPMKNHDEKGKCKDCAKENEGAAETKKEKGVEESLREAMETAISESFREDLHPRGRGGKWVAKFFHGSDVAMASSGPSGRQVVASHELEPGERLADGSRVVSVKRSGKHDVVVLSHTKKPDVDTASSVTQAPTGKGSKGPRKAPDLRDAQLPRKHTMDDVLRLAKGASGSKDGLLSHDTNRIGMKFYWPTGMADPHGFSAAHYDAPVAGGKTERYHVVLGPDNKVLSVHETEREAEQAAYNRALEAGHDVGDDWPSPTPRHRWDGF